MGRHGTGESLLRRWWNSGNARARKVCLGVGVVQEPLSGGGEDRVDVKVILSLCRSQVLDRNVDVRISKARSAAEDG